MKRVFTALAFAPLVISTSVFAQAPAPATPPAPPPPAPMTVLSQSAEHRFQIDYQVNAEALAKLLPAGWVSNVAAQGPAKDCNIRMIFIEASNVTGPDNRPLGKGNDVMVILAAPVKKADGTGTGQMILGGIAQNDVAGAFGVLDQASGVKVTRNIANVNGAKTVTEDWELATAGGALASLHVKYTSMPANRGGGSTNFYNPADPAKYQIFRTDQVTDIARNLTTNPPDRVLEYSYKASGGDFASLFDGKEKTLSWDPQPVFNRTVGNPIAP